MADYHKRSLVKTVTYRASATLITVFIAYAFTGRILVSIGIGSLEVITKIVLYYSHERMWDRVKWGKRHVKKVDS